MEENSTKKNASTGINKVAYSRHVLNGMFEINRTIARDRVISEQPLQINLQWYGENTEIKSRVFAITMRTLGDEQYLIVGLLFSEGIIKSIADIENISLESSIDNNNWQVQLIKGKQPKLTSIERFQTTYSSCGLCGATSLKALELKEPPNLLALAKQSTFSVQHIYSLAETMASKQTLFTLTGGVHSAALFDVDGQLLSVFEDIGRHNAVDKLVGDWLYKQTLFEQTMHKHQPQTPQLLVMLVSGRVSFEIVQKAVMAGISILVSVGAPSDLSIKAAQRFELTLIGFANTESFNVYSGDWRIVSSSV